MTERQRTRGSQRSRAWAQILGGVLLANVLFAVFVPNGDLFLRAIQDFLWTYSGVIALVGLTGSVVFGLASTDRLMLSVEHRILLQATHRAIAVASLGFLIAHIALQVAFARVSLLDVFVPFGAPDLAVGFGSIASTLFLTIIVTGMLRARFANSSRPWLWRVLHVSSYLCWPVAIVHGLNAGRSPDGYVLVSYAACLVAVGMALLARLVLTVRPKISARENVRAVDIQPVEAPARGGGKADKADRADRTDKVGKAERVEKVGGRTEPAPLDDDLAFWTSMRGKGA